MGWGIEAGVGEESLLEEGENDLEIRSHIVDADCRRLNDASPIVMALHASSKHKDSHVSIHQSE